MQSWKGFNVELNKSLAEYTSWKVGGPANVFYNADNIEELAKFVQYCRGNFVDMYVLGGGSNLLVRDEGVSGAVIRINTPGFGDINIEGNKCWIGAGVKLSNFVKKAAGLGLSGLEGLAGIPGTVGGALKMNAGGKYGVVSSCLNYIKGITHDGKEVEMKREDIKFEYRASGLEDIIILGAYFTLTPSEPVNVQSRTREIFEEKAKSQPLELKTAGCVFKNPPGDSAGRLIDQLGMKGVMCGEAVVSDTHANFIINRGNAKASDIMSLINMIREQVLHSLRVRLELEIKVW